jgi:shikimate dehydrogenase
VLRLGVIGWPVSHSLSPIMQAAGLRALGLEGSYELLPIDPTAFENGIDQLVVDGFSGWNATVPHKGAMAARVDVIDPTAAAAQSVNTVAVRDGRLHGWSTDGYGLEQALAESFDLTPAGSRIMFWGTGGAARAVAVHLARAGAALTLANRTRTKAEALAEIVREVVPGVSIEVVSANAEDAACRAATEADVILQGTSVGLKPEDPSAIPKAVIANAQAIYDMIYKPTTTLTAAAAAGIPHADGRSMLLHQGVRSLEIWTGKEGPVEIMRQALYQALG